jgi:hypothetical protein
MAISKISYVNFKNAKQFESCSHLNQFQAKNQLIMLTQLPILFSNHHQISQTNKQTFEVSNLTMVEFQKETLTTFFYPFSDY